MQKTAEGKLVLFDVATGEQREFWPIDARALIELGSHSTEPPEGVAAVPPPQPPTRVGVPKAPTVTVHEAVEAPVEAVAEVSEPVSEEVPEEKETPKRKPARGRKPRKKA
jgi:hypothetical protein